MKQTLDELKKHFEEFTKDAEQQANSGVKAAGARARKTSLAIEKKLKEFRKQSIEASK